MLSSLTTFLLADATEVGKGGPGSGPRPGGGSANPNGVQMPEHFGSFSTENAHTLSEHTQASNYHRTAANAALKLNIPRQAQIHNRAADAHDRAARAISQDPYSDKAVIRSQDARTASVSANKGKMPEVSHRYGATTAGSVIGGAIGGAGMGAVAGGLMAPLVGSGPGAVVGGALGAISGFGDISSRRAAARERRAPRDATPVAR